MGSNMEAIDCASTLTATEVAALKSSGIVAVGRYLGHKNMNWWKTIGPDEVQIIHDAGLALILIWESNPTYAGYFDYSKGVSDAKLAVDEVASLGAPKGTAIYFAVDYDAQTGDMAAIEEYFRGVRDGLARQYLVGVYGSYDVMAALALQESTNPPDKYYQTYAWSGGQVFEGNHVYQYQNDVIIAGVSADRDKIQSMAGTWPEIGEKYMPKHAIIYFTDRDFSSARIVSDRLGGCGMFCRNADNSFIHPDAKAAEHLVMIGGAEYHDHPNVTNCCGAGAPETAIVAARYAQTL
ncbi:MAG: DUF1906 domain-containing protein [Desulfitobacteriaceae bacterium]